LVTGGEWIMWSSHHICVAFPLAPRDLFDIKNGKTWTVHSLYLSKHAQN
jgi:hypothetical protein